MSRTNHCRRGVDAPAKLKFSLVNIKSEAAEHHHCCHQQVPRSSGMDDQNSSTITNTLLKFRRKVHRIPEQRYVEGTWQPPIQPRGDSAARLGRGKAFQRGTLQQDIPPVGDPTIQQDRRRQPARRGGFGARRPPIQLERVPTGGQDEFLPPPDDEFWQPVLRQPELAGGDGDEEDHHEERAQFTRFQPADLSEAPPPDDEFWQPVLQQPEIASETGFNEQPYRPTTRLPMGRADARPRFEYSWRPGASQPQTLIEDDWHKERTRPGIPQPQTLSEDDWYEERTRPVTQSPYRHVETPSPIEDIWRPPARAHQLETPYSDDLYDEPARPTRHSPTVRSEREPQLDSYDDSERPDNVPTFRNPSPPPVQPSKFTEVYSSDDEPAQPTRHSPPVRSKREPQFDLYDGSERPGDVPTFRKPSPPPVRPSELTEVYSSDDEQVLPLPPRLRSPASPIHSNLHEPVEPRDHQPATPRRALDDDEDSEPDYDSFPEDSDDSEDEDAYSHEQATHHNAIETPASTHSPHYDDENSENSWSTTSSDTDSENEEELSRSQQEDRDLALAIRLSLQDEEERQTAAAATPGLGTSRPDPGDKDLSKDFINKRITRNPFLASGNGGMARKPLAYADVEVELRNKNGLGMESGGARNPFGDF